MILSFFLFSFLQFGMKFGGKKMMVFSLVEDLYLPLKHKWRVSGCFAHFLFGIYVHI